MPETPGWPHRHGGPVIIISPDRFTDWKPTEHSYCPQPAGMMRARFEAAINHIHYLAEDLKKPQSEWAATDKTHVFDFEDGLRLIISRDAENRPPLWAIRTPSTIHVSASLRSRSELDLSLAPIVSRESFQAVIIAHLEQISNFVGELESHFIGDPPKRVLHLWFKEIR